MLIAFVEIFLVLRKKHPELWVPYFLHPLSTGDTAGNIARDYVFFNGKRVAFVGIASGNQHYYYSDHLGTASVMSNSDGSTIEWAADYFPFGASQVTNSYLDNRYRFTGYEFDPETGYNYAGYRTESPALGRFFSPDPYSGSMDLTNPQSMNRYAYTLNSPTNYTDPYGLICSGATRDEIHDTPCNNANFGGGGGGGGRDSNEFALMNIPTPPVMSKWGWIPITPDSGISDPIPPVASVVQTYAYWGLTPTPTEPDFNLFSVTCLLFCGTDGNEVFNRIYPRDPTLPIITAATPPRPTPKPTISDIITACLAATALRMGGGGADSSLGGISDSIDTGADREKLDFGTVEYTPGIGPGNATGNAAAYLGNTNGCIARGLSYR